jgi:threonine dehydrogenase-like Zn-dependent dehydrogenase
MKTRAVRLYGKNDLRLEEFELPEINDDEILARVVCDSICMSSYKATREADIHKRVPRDVAQNPVIIGHEFAGELVEVGARWRHKFAAGDRFSIQPALNYPGSPVGILGAPGYSYRRIGGDATYIVIPAEVMEQDCLLRFEGEGFYRASLSEPLSCVIGAMHANYHTTPGSYIHRMDIVERGAMAILAGVGPMGLAALNYAIRRERTPRLLVVTDIDQARLDRAATLYPASDAAARGIDLRYVNTSAMADPAAELRELTGGRGFDDVFVFAPVASLVEQADAMLAPDGCLNFFAGPANPAFRASLNFYNVHYAATHIAGTSGGNTDDMREALAMMDAGLDPAGLVTHIGGLDAVIDTTMRLPEIPGGKKLIYTHIEMPLTAIADFGKLGGAGDRLFAALDEICRRHNGLWSVEAERYLLANGKLRIED